MLDDAAVTTETVITLTVSDLEPVTAADTVALGQAHVLAVLSPEMAGAIDAITITQTNVLTVSDATVAPTLDGVTWFMLSLGAIHCPSVANVTPARRIINLNACTGS